MVCLAWVATVMAKDVFEEREHVSKDMIYGAINVYLLATMVFAAAYELQIILVPLSTA